MNRRTFLVSGLGTGGSAFGWGGLVEARWLALRRVSCQVPGLRHTVRLLHLSDLHASPVVPEALIEEAIHVAIRERPDVICVTGDFVTGYSGFREPWYVRTLRRLSEAAPTYGTLGNHDGGEWACTRVGFATSRNVLDLIRAAGIRPLHNSHAREAGLELVGLGDLWADEFRPKQAFPTTATEVPRVVLSHNPDTKSALVDFRWNLMLSGHTHGGQVVVPWVGSPWAPVADHRYLSGLKPWRDRWIHVSTGVGSAGGLLLNCRPEVTVVSLHS